jgi:hypothetical protein
MMRRRVPETEQHRQGGTVKQLACEGCGRRLPMNDLHSVFGRTLCETCKDRAIEERPDGRAPAESVFQHRDPTVCAACGKDCVMVELAKVAGLPVCPTCEAQLLKRPFPAWVKLSFAAILLLAAVETARNWRLFQAYFEIPRAIRAFDEGRVEEASELMTRAAAHVPEISALRDRATFYRGLRLSKEGKYADSLAILEGWQKTLPPKDAADVEPLVVQIRVMDLLSRDESAPAVELARALARKHPDDSGATDLQASAEIANAFDTRDYEAFLVWARRQEERHPKSAYAAAQVASALACKYAVTGEERYRRDSLAQMDKARTLDDKTANLTEYEERIRHRLDTREIIDKKEYDNRFRSDARKGATP